MISQVSDSELELMKIVWASGGTALYAHIMDELSRAGRTWQKNTVITLLSRLVEKGLLKTNKISIWPLCRKGIIRRRKRRRCLISFTKARRRAWWPRLSNVKCLPPPITMS